MLALFFAFNNGSIYRRRCHLLSTLPLHMFHIVFRYNALYSLSILFPATLLGKETPLLSRLEHVNTPKSHLVRNLTVAGHWMISSILTGSELWL